MINEILYYSNSDYDFLFLADGPVSVGMSLDIASIDTISEINMVL